MLSAILPRAFALLLALGPSVAGAAPGIGPTAAVRPTAASRPTAARAGLRAPGPRALGAGMPGPAEDAPAIVRRAERAVAGDSAAALRAQWRARLARAPGDRAALLGLATLARLTYDYPESERVYRQLLASSPAPPDGYAVQAALGVGLGLEDRSFAMAAIAQFTQARVLARAAGDRLAEGEALVWLTFDRGRLQGIPVAEATLDSAARLVPPGALATQARIAQRRAVLYSLRARPDASLEAERGIALAERAGDLRALADGYVALGKVLQYRGADDSALVVLRRAEAVYLRGHAGGALATSLIWQAQVLGATGRYGAMQEVMRKALQLGNETHNPGAAADAYRAFGALDIMLGEFAAAGDNLDRSAAISRASGDSSGLRTTRKFVVDVAMADADYAAARRLVDELLARATQPREEFELRDELVSIAIREHDWAAAERALAGARSVLPRVPGVKYPNWVAHDEARIALARGDLDVAERALKASLRTSAGYSADFMRSDAWLRLADIADRRGDAAGAERAMVAAADELDSWRARLSEAEVRVMAFQASAMQTESAEEPGEQPARVARVLAGLVAAGRAPAAFELAERRRARELRDRFLRAEAMRGAAAVVAAKAAPGATEERATAGDMIAVLPDARTAVLEYVGGTPRAPTTVFVLQRDGMRALRLPRLDALDERVSTLAALLESGADAGALARSLGGALLDPALGLLAPGVTRLVIVPDGVLHRVAWDALRLSDGHYAVERYAISLAPSAAMATALWRQQARPRPTAAVRLLAFGDPAFAREQRGDESAAAETFRSAFDAAGGLARLPASADEARLVARYAPESVVRLRSDASASYLKRSALAGFRVIHFATHALVDERGEARTALALAPGPGESGFVGPGDLAALRLDADLVVLSACRTAGGKVLVGEGVQGLTAPLLQAGSRSVVATQWRIGDQSTLALMRSFYDALARRLPVGDALRAAKLDALRRGAPPREWAAFVAVGNPLVEVPLRTPSRTPWWRWLAGAGAVGALVAFLRPAWRRRRAPVRD